MSEPLQAFRDVVIPIDFGVEEIASVRVPINLELLERIEETLQKCEDYGWKWMRIKKGDKTIIQAYTEFCHPYIPEFDFKRAQPNFPMLFFSRVRSALVDSIQQSMPSTPSTEA